MQTAIEWLQDNCFETYLDNKIYCNGKEITFEVEQAKQLEKKQIEDAWEDGKGAFSTRQSEEYYNEQYKK